MPNRPNPELDLRTLENDFGFRVCLGIRRVVLVSLSGNLSLVFNDRISLCFVHGFGLSGFAF